MSNNFCDEIEFKDSFQEEEDAGTEGNLVCDRFYIPQFQQMIPGNVIN